MSVSFITHCTRPSSGMIHRVTLLLSRKERSKDHEGYVQAVTRAAKHLEKQRFLLPADVQQYIAAAHSSNVLL